jgi:hypothetical protein
MKSNEEKIEVLIKVPKNWLDLDQLDLLTTLGGSIRHRVSDAILEKATKEIVSKIKLPKFKINVNDVKNKMLSILAQKALEQRSHE